mmetsp:Transcript_41021/g.80304  ORF Transcript_41021/g.80304 Transcript_41021/m.80304 type:complete len:144 (+) Transcript_41021:169-600(+)|eukprot:CAMPEP_0194302828 /NCGR_PEP_ID=MMETSP0171-20130528/697_1 /TAXON_ID=218684 /ORGANISM="Corethron pennatum, Strain L29A3" /LENGTH=143 /DNA_ID=CAMNT_0039053469 /DNA_START=147 /DNA_END=578 /DNA_ORIENTATION=+
MNAGVVVSDEVHSSFVDFKLKRDPHHCRYLVYRLADDRKSIIVDAKGPITNTFEDFCAELPADDCRYGLVDVEVTTDEGRATSKLVFISWNPDSCKIRTKMLYAASKDTLKSALGGVGIIINATSACDLDYDENVRDVVLKYT